MGMRIDAELALHISNASGARVLLGCCRDDVPLVLHQYDRDYLATNRSTRLADDEPVNFPDSGSVIDIQ